MLRVQRLKDCQMFQHKRQYKSLLLSDCQIPQVGLFLKVHCSSKNQKTTQMLKAQYEKQKFLFEVQA